MQTNLTSWVLVLNRIDSLLEDIIKRSGPYLLLPETREAVVVQQTPAADGGCSSGISCAQQRQAEEQTIFDVHATIIILRFSSLLLMNSTNKDVYNSVEVSHNFTAMAAHF